MKNRAKRRLPTLTAAVAALALLLPAAAAADVPEPAAGPHDSAPAEVAAAEVQEGAIFNDPNGDEAEQYVIRDYIQGLVERSPEGSSITMSIYNITEFDLDLATELLRASFNGVSVQLVLEGSTAGQTPVGKMLLAGLGEDTEEESWAIACDEGCHGVNINHNKFFLFSEVDGTRDVVVQSSANFTVQNGSRYFNNAVTFADNRELYDGYMEYFHDLARNQVDREYYRTFEAGNVKTTLYPVGPSYPIDGPQDPLVNELDEVTCEEGTVIRGAHMYIGRPEVADKLTELADEGCVVKIAYTEFNFGVDDILIGHPGIELRFLDDIPEENMIHSKYLIIEGGYAGQPDQHVTITGSPNISYNAQNENDEAMLTIKDEEIHDQYHANFQDVWFDDSAVVP